MTEQFANPPEAAESSINRIGIIGAGAVGATTAYAMIQAGSASEIVLVDKDRRRAEGQAMDLRHCLPFVGYDYAALSIEDLEDLRSCDLIVVTAGVAQKEGESRLELVKRNAEIFSSFFPLLNQNNPKARFLIVTNPVDVMTRVALKFSGLPPERVFGSGTVLDTSRFRALLADFFGVLPRQVHAYVIGEHGDSEVLAWSRAMIGPIHVSEYSERVGQTLSPDDIDTINKGVREAAYYIISRVGATQFAIAMATVQIVNALSHRPDSLLTVSRQLGGVHGFNEVCMSVPTRVNRRGPHSPIELDLSATEHAALKRSGEVLDEVYQGLGL